MIFFVAFVGIAILAAAGASGAIPAALAPRAPWVQAALYAVAAHVLFRIARAVVFKFVHGEPKEPLRRIPWHAPVDEAAGIFLLALALGAAGDALTVAGPGQVLLGLSGAFLAFTGAMSATLAVLAKRATPEQIAKANAEPAKGRKVRFVFSVLLLAAFLLPVFLTPAIGRCTAWDAGYDGVVLEALRGCGEARALLGDEIGPSSYGWSCGSMETGGGAGNADWAMPVAGTRGRGRYAFTAEQHGGRWTLTGAELTVGARTVNVLACPAAGGPTSAAPPPATAGDAPPPTAAQVEPARAQPEPGATPASGAGLAATEQACQAGHAPSCVTTGAAFEQGSGAPQDLRRARERYDRACALGFQAGCLLRDKLPPTAR